MRRAAALLLGVVPAGAMVAACASFDASHAPERPDAGTPSDASTQELEAGDVEAEGKVVDVSRYRVVVEADAITWEAANEKAKAAKGHLVTITSREENDAVYGLARATEGAFDGDFGPWIGAIRASGSPTPDAGWAWVTSVAWKFTAWAPGEPNGANGAEDRAVYFGPWSGEGMWADVPGDFGFVRSYVIERD